MTTTSTRINLFSGDPYLTAFKIRMVMDTETLDAFKTIQRQLGFTDEEMDKHSEITISSSSNKFIREIIVGGMIVARCWVDVEENSAVVTKEIL